MGLIENNLLPIAWALLGLSAVTVLWALFWDRPRGRLRCRKCRYRMEGTPPVADGSITCPECGRTHKDERSTRFTRRRWKMGTLALLVALTSWYAVDYHWRFNERGWWGYVPTTLLILHPVPHSLLIDQSEKAWVFAASSSDFGYGDPPLERELEYRVRTAWTWDWQLDCWRWFVKRRFETTRRASEADWADKVICRTYDLSELTLTHRMVFPRDVRGTRMYCWSRPPSNGARLRDSDMGEWTANLTEPLEWLIPRPRYSGKDDCWEYVQLEVGDTFTLICDEERHQLFAAVLAAIREPTQWSIGEKMPDAASLTEHTRAFGESRLVVVAFDIRWLLDRARQRGLIHDDPDSVWEFLGDYFSLFDRELYDGEIDLWQFTTLDTTRILAAGEPRAVVKLANFLEQYAESALAPPKSND